MKNAMKKIVCMMLAVMMMISVFPMAASAAGQVKLVVKLDSKDNVLFDEFVSIKDDTAIVSNLLTHKTEINWTEYDFSHAWSSAEQVNKGLDDSVKNGDTISIMLLTKKVEEQPEQKPEEKPEQKPEEKPEEKPAEVKPINLVVKVNDSGNIVYTGSKIPANGKYTNVEDLLYYCWNKSWEATYTFDHAWSHDQQANLTLAANVNAGDTLYFMLKTKSSTNTNNNSNNVIVGSGTDKLSNFKVYLNVYLNTTIGYPDKTIDITKGAALDGLVKMSEAEAVVLNYYNAKTSAGIAFDGLYLGEGAYSTQYITDSAKYDGFEVSKRDHDITLNIYINNAVAKNTSSSTADSSNPKTGDTIYTAMTVMGLSAAALAAAAYVYSKKRVAM